MGELLPEFWSAPRDEDSDSKRNNKVRHSRKVTDVFTWLQCFCSFVSVRAQPNPELSDPGVDGLHGHDCLCEPGLPGLSLGTWRSQPRDEGPPEGIRNSHPGHVLQAPSCPEGSQRGPSPALWGGLLQVEQRPLLLPMVPSQSHM